MILSTGDGIARGNWWGAARGPIFLSMNETQDEDIQIRMRNVRIKLPHS